LNKDADRDLHKEVDRGTSPMSEETLRDYAGSIRMQRAKCIASDDPRLKEK